MVTKNDKKRNWAFVLYPESAPSNWLDILRETGLPIAVSPLHDRDINPDGEPKKAHHHVILHYDGPTTFNVVKKIPTMLNQPIPIPLESIRGQYRYLTHKDNPEKAQYDEQDIVLLNGFCLSDYNEKTRSEVNAIKKSIQGLVRDMDILEYSDLLDYLMDNDLFDEYDIAASNTVLFNTYISSRRNKIMPKSN